MVFSIVTMYIFVHNAAITVMYSAMFLSLRILQRMQMLHANNMSLQFGQHQ